MSRNVIVVITVAAALVSSAAPGVALARGASHLSNAVGFTSLVGQSRPAPQQRPAQRPPTPRDSICYGCRFDFSVENPNTLPANPRVNRLK